MSKILVTEIMWDTDGERVPQLPDRVVLSVDGCESDDELEFVIGNMLSDMYGFCHLGFCYEKCE